MSTKKSSTLGRLHSQNAVSASGDEFINRYLVINSNIEIKNVETGEVLLAGGDKNRIINMYDAENSALTLRERDYITEEELTKKLAYIKEKGVKFQLVRRTA